MKFLNITILAAGVMALALSPSASASGQTNQTLTSVPQTSSLPAPVSPTNSTIYNWSQLGARMQGGAQGIGSGATTGVGTITDRIAGGDSASSFKGIADISVGTCGGCSANNVILQGVAKTDNVGFSGIRVTGPNAANAGASSVAVGAIEMYGVGATVRGVSPVTVPTSAPHN